MTIYVIEGVNPEPWTPGRIGYNAKSGRPFKIKDVKLSKFQDALGEELKEIYNPDPLGKSQLFSMVFWFWRSTEQGNVADATNLQKATEDALQQVLFPNDRACRDIRSVIVEQTPDTRPKIIIEIQAPMVVPVPPNVVMPRRGTDVSPDVDRRADYNPDF